MTNPEFNYTVADVEDIKARVKRDYSKLPRVKKFRVESAGLVGKVGEARCTWLLLVCARGAEGAFENYTHVAATCGIQVKRYFKTKEDAIAAGKDAMKNWGKAKPAPKAVQTKLDKIREALAARGLEEAEIEEILRG